MIKLFKYLLLLIILFFCRKSFALQAVLDKGYEIRKLSSLKWEYEQNLFLKKSDKADSLLVLYRRQLELIKKPKNDFLKFIKYSLKYYVDSLKMMKNVYMYVDPFDNKHLHYTSIRVSDLYLVIKKYLFENRQDLLPLDFSELKEINLDSYSLNTSKYSLQEIVGAQKYLLNNINFKRKQKREVKSKINESRIVEIKEYLVEEGLNEETISFIEWGFDDMILNKSIPIMIWKVSFDSNKGKKYEIRDKDPN